MAWNIISDNDVRAIWTDSEGNQTPIDMSFYPDSGIPVDSETDDELTYSHTEIKIDGEWVKVADHNVKHNWIDSDAIAHSVYPTFYEESGIPVDGDTGDDMVYVDTQYFTSP